VLDHELHHGHDSGCSSGGCGCHEAEDHGNGNGNGCGSHARKSAAPAAPALIELGVMPAARPQPQHHVPCRGMAFLPTERYPQGLMVGLDVGSTTVKAVVVDPVTDEILWKDYQRHDTKQPEKCLEFLERIASAFPGVEPNTFRVFATGSGGSAVGRHLCAKFVQEVNAVSLAVEKLYPDVQSVVELGGQDAKIIVFKEDPETGRKKKVPSMNDKCAGGTGAVIDKINAKLKVPAENLCNMGYLGLKLHPVAG
jgi:activator of 2-hydroxyglutaryl-CoA dehydratase